MPNDRKWRQPDRKSLVGRFSLLVIVLVVAFCSSVRATECEYHRVRWVIDGDTVVIDTGQKVRLIGVDTPEKGDRRRDVEFYAIEAMQFLRSEIQGQRVCLKKDPLQRTGRDNYGRLLRYIYLNNRFINKELVQKGYAYVFTSYPFNFISEFKTLEARARAQGLGIWNTTLKCQWEQALINSMKLADTCGSNGTICPWQAGQYVNKKVTVRMFVHRVIESRKYTFFDSERDYHSPLNLRVLIPPEEPEPYKYLGRVIDVTGRITLYKDRPELIMEQLRLLHPK